MGSAASTNVKEIKIDQTDNKWDRLQTQKDKKKGFNISKRWVSSAEADSSSNRRQRQLNSSLEAAEKRAIEAEQRVRQLEREVGTLELRNMELAEEVTWLKKQLSDHPEVPILPRPTTASSLRTKDVDIADDYSRQKSLQNVMKLEEQIKRYEDEILKLKTKLNKDTQRLQAELEDQKHTFDREMRSVDNHLVLSRKMNEIYEDVIRKNLPADTLADIKCRINNDQYSMAGSSSLTNNHVVASDSLNSSKSRAQLILELTEQISNHKDKIRNLENDIVKRDIEIVHLKEMMTASDAALQASLSVANFKKLSNEVRRPAFSAVRRQSTPTITDNSKPLKVDRSNDDMHDEIRALLKTPNETNTNVENTTESTPIAASQKISLPVIRSDKLVVNSDDDDSLSDERSRKGQKRTISAPKKIHSDSVLKNIYTFSDDFEAIRVKDSPSASSTSMRPKTANPNSSGARPKSTYKQHSIIELVELEDESTKRDTTEVVKSRTHSAPMLFKPRPASRGTNKNTAIRPEPEGYAVEKATKQDTADIMSLNDVDLNKSELPSSQGLNDEMETLDVLQSSFRKPPLPTRSKARNSGSAASIYSSSAVGSEDNESDDEIRRLLEKHSARPNQRAAVGGSAKSRDSGFLGESYTSAQSTNLWQNDDVAASSKKSDSDG